MLILLALACGDPAPAPVPAPPPAPEPSEAPEPVAEPQPEFHVPVGHCKANERNRFTCSVGKGKTASVCEIGGALSYRFGKPGQVELTLPRPGGDGFAIARRSTGEDSEIHVASVWNDGHRYAIVSERTEDQFEGRVVVRKGAEVVVSLPCKGQPTVDFTEIAGRFEGDKAAHTAWIGTWEAESGEASITITEVPAADEGAPASLHATGEATWHGAGDNVHTGEIDGALASADGAFTMTEPCSVKLQRMVADTLYVEDDGRCGGMNVTFSGTYFRVP
ncbi:MAG: hypothetical protein R3F61_04800 [Myxococcota bacterium]